MSITTKQAVNTLTTALKNDPDLFYAYQANIAMAIMDTYHAAVEHTKQEYDQLHLIANEGAMRFLNRLCEDRPTNRELSGVEEIAEERGEHFTKHGWDVGDDYYVNGELVQAAFYAMGNGIWPLGWDSHFADKIVNKDPIGRLRVAGSLIAAEIDRLKRKQQNQQQPNQTT